MIVKIEKEKISSELAQVILSLLEDKEVTFPRGLFLSSGDEYNEEAIEMYNKLYDIVDDIMNEFKLEEI